MVSEGMVERVREAFKNGDKGKLELLLEDATPGMREYDDKHSELRNAFFEARCVVPVPNEMLAQIVRDGDGDGKVNEALEELVDSVVSLVRRAHARKSESFSIGEAFANSYRGVWLAAKKFDWTRRASFSTFCYYYIRNEVGPRTNAHRSGRKDRLSRVVLSSPIQRHGTDRNTSLADTVSYADSLQRSTITEDDRRDYQEALSSLMSSDRDAALVVDYKRKGYTDKEVAEMLSVSIGCVSKLKTRGKKKLAKMVS